MDGTDPTHERPRPPLPTRNRQPLTPAQRSMAARLAALSRWAQVTDRTAATQPARDALAAKWDAAPNPAAAKQAHMLKMSLAASRRRSG